MTMVEISGWAIGQGRLKRSSPSSASVDGSGLGVRLPATSRHRHRLAHILDHGPRDLELAHDHGRGAVLLQVKHLLLGMGPGNDEQIGIGGARLHHRLTAFEGLGDRHQEATGRGEVGGAPLRDRRRCR